MEFGRGDVFVPPHLRITSSSYRMRMTVDGAWAPADCNENVSLAIVEDDLVQVYRGV